MKRAGINIIMIAMAAVVLSGCADLRSKFIPKPKEEERLPTYYAVRPYDVHPSLDLYTKRYVYWKNWHREFLDVLSYRQQNHKKRLVAIEQEISNLIDMRNMLTDEKSDQLQKIIDQMAEVQARLKKEKITRGNEVQVRRKMELLGKEVKKDFSYRKVGDDIRTDFRKD